MHSPLLQFGQLLLVITGLLAPGVVLEFPEFRQRDITRQRVNLRSQCGGVVARSGRRGADIARALAEAAADPRPSLVACKTVIGQGAPNKAGSHSVHGSPLGADEVAATRVALGWTAAPFEVPAEILADWRSLGAKGAAAATNLPCSASVSRC